MPYRSFEFTHAITRQPSKSVVNGLTTANLGAPDIAAMSQVHDTYVATLRETGAKITVLPPLPDYPDSVFVEDACLCLPQGAILMRPGAPSRLGEVAEISDAIHDHYKTVTKISGPGFVDGGDILVTETEILVGLSARTNREGIQELAKITADWGYQLREVSTPPGVLHFKTDCSLLDHETILSTPRLAATGCFERYKVIETAPGQEAAANSIRFNQFVLAPSGFDETAERLDKGGYELRLIDNREFAKLDGGMSCLSLRF